jgi:hypothetical protein
LNSLLGIDDGSMSVSIYCKVRLLTLAAPPQFQDLFCHARSHAK